MNTKFDCGKINHHGPINVFVLKAAWAKSRWYPTVILNGVMTTKNMNKEIVLQVRSVYGNKNIYPVCHVANALIKFKDPKITFNSEDLKTMKSLGLIIKWKAETI